MNIDPLRLVAFLHVLLFVYWLGGDLGVFLCGARLTRDDLSLDERLRTREIGILLDMGPRTALPLMVPVGFTLAIPYGSPIVGAPLVLLWLATLAWVALIWMVHHKKGTPTGQTLQGFDYVIRYTLMPVMAVIGLSSLATETPFADRWLATKILLFAVIILNGLWLRRIGGRWQAAFDLVRAGGEARITGEQMIKDNRATAKVAALSIWFLVALMAFLGVVKPF